MSAINCVFILVTTFALSVSAIAQNAAQTIADRPKIVFQQSFAGSWDKDPDVRFMGSSTGGLLYLYKPVGDNRADNAPYELFRIADGQTQKENYQGLKYSMPGTVLDRAGDRYVLSRKTDYRVNTEIYFRLSDETQLLHLEGGNEFDCAKMAKTEDRNKIDETIEYSAPQISPSGKFIAVIQACADLKDDRYQGERPIGRAKRVRLRIYAAADGSLISDIDGVRQFLWLSDDRLAVSNAPSGTSGDLRIVFCSQPLHLGDEFNVRVVTPQGQLVKKIWSSTRLFDNCRTEATEWVELFGDLKNNRILVLRPGATATDLSSIDTTTFEKKNSAVLHTRPAPIVGRQYQYANEQVFEVDGLKEKGGVVELNSYSARPESFGKQLSTNKTDVGYGALFVRGALVWLANDSKSYQIQISGKDVATIPFVNCDGQWALKDLRLSYKISDRYFLSSYRCKSEAFYTVWEVQ